VSLLANVCTTSAWLIASDWHTAASLNATSDMLDAEAARGLVPTGYDDVPDEFNAQECDGVSHNVVLTGSNLTRLNAMTFRDFNFSLSFTRAVFAIEVKMRLALTGNVVVMPARLYVGGAGLVVTGNDALVGGNELRVLEASFNNSAFNSGFFVDVVAQFNRDNAFLFERSIADLNDAALGVRVLFAGLDTPNDTAAIDCVSLRYLYEADLVSTDIVGAGSAVAPNSTSQALWSNLTDAVMCDGNVAVFAVPGQSSATQTSNELQLFFQNISTPAVGHVVDSIDLVMLVYSSSPSDVSVSSISGLRFRAFNKVITQNVSLPFSADQHNPYYRLVTSLDVPPNATFVGNSALKLGLKFAVSPGNASLASNQSIETGVDCAFIMIYWKRISNSNATSTTSTPSPTTAITPNSTATTAANATTTAFFTAAPTTSSNNSTAAPETTANANSTTTAMQTATVTVPAAETTIAASLSLTTATVNVNETNVSDNRPGSETTLIYVGAALGVALFATVLGAVYYIWRQRQKAVTSFVTI
jgi:hypothetical protein